MLSTAIAKDFHVYADVKTAYDSLLPASGTDHFVFTERDVSYRFYPHFHPYTGRLVRKLLQGGTRGLQAADTEYVKPPKALPDSVELALAANAILTVPTGAGFILALDRQATAAGGVAINLAAGMQLESAANAQMRFPGGLRAVLENGMANPPASDSDFVLSQDQPAILSADFPAVLVAATAVVIHDGTQATLPAGTEVTLLRATRLVVPNGMNAKLLKSTAQPVLFAEIFAPAVYDPQPLVQHPYPVKDLDFTFSGAYSVYNWELFFHVPITIAMHLSKNQRFADAQRWFHYLFDPTDDSEGPTPERFWKVRPFQYTDVKKIEEVLVNLATGEDEELRSETVRSIEAWKDAPFRPHVIARFRQQAYMYKTVMAYLDNLVAWGDSLFRQDTGEAVDEALMLYVLAANILGPRPQPVPRKGAVRPQTYENLRKDLAQFGTAMRELEADGGFDLMPFPTDGSGNDDQLATVRSLGKALYFGVPRNDKLLSYWDTVADRLFKIHNSLNLQGIFRQLALFEPPIDPAMLARAAAAGLDVGAIVNGLNQQLPLVRFQQLAQRAAEICQEVKSLGNSLLSAMEKEDGEAMAVLRAKHERVVMEMVEHVKYGQVQESIKAREGLLQSLGLALQRYAYYERQLGKKADEIEKAIPEFETLDRDALEKMKFAMKEPDVSPRQIEVDIASDVGAQAAQALNGGKLLSSNEVRESLLLEAAQIASDVSNILSAASSVAHAVPTFQGNIQFWGMGATVEYGGKDVGAALTGLSGAARAVADRISFEARRASRIDGFARREREWAFQSNLAAGEISQMFRQLRAAEIRQAIAEQELKNHRQQMKHADEIERFLNEEGTQANGKRSNKALYAWMKREVKGMYAQCFQFAFDMAKKAERALQHEIGDPGLSYLQFGYLAGKEGLLAGEKLVLDIERMKMAYQDLNRREYELTKHVSLLQVDPLALIALRTTGRCTVKLPESLFDMDGPGHYFRRIKSVGVSIPCVTGPYASVNCTLTLLKSSIRKVATLSSGEFARQDAEDDRFSDNFGSLQSIVTSSSQNDSGMFETNLRDERYLPFENSGAISEWQLELPADPSKGDPRQFDYDTISDVVLHVRYMAREGGALMRKGAVSNLVALAESAQASGAVRLFSIPHEFPTEWARFRSQIPAANQRFELALQMRPEHYPFWSQGRLNSVARVDLLARSSKTPVPGSVDVFDRADKADPAPRSESLAKDLTLGGLLRGQFRGGAPGFDRPASPVGTIKLYFDERDIADLWIAVTWSAS